MNQVTIEGPVTILSDADYQALLGRIAHMEELIEQLAATIEALDDVRVMREAEVEYRSGDAIAFDKLLEEVQSET